MTMNEYQEIALSIPIFEHDGEIPYLSLGISGEAGEVDDKVKKVIRDNEGHFTMHIKKQIMMELGDVMWYVANMADALAIPFQR